MSRFDGLERLSLLFVVAGVSVLYVASVVYAPPELAVSAIDEQYIGDTVVVEGEVTDYVAREDAQFLTISGQEAEIDAVYFGDTPDLAQPGGRYQIEGEVDVYDGALQLIVRDVERIGVVS